MYVQKTHSAYIEYYSVPRMSNESSCVFVELKRVKKRLCYAETKSLVVKCCGKTCAVQRRG